MDKTELDLNLGYIKLMKEAWEEAREFEGEVLADRDGSIESTQGVLKDIQDEVGGFVTTFINELELVEAAVKAFPRLYPTLPEDLRANREIALSAAGRLNMKAVPGSLLNDPSFILELYWYNPELVPGEAVNKYITDKEKLLDHIARDEYFVKNIPDAWAGDKDFWLKAMEANGMSMHFLPPRFWQDRDLAVTAVKQTGWAIKYCSPMFQSDPEIIKLAIAHDERHACWCNPAAFEEDPELIQKKGLLKEYGCMFGHYRFKV